jgi:hypothetical protein
MAKTLFLTRIHLLSTSQHVSMNKDLPIQEATEAEKGETAILLEGSQTVALRHAFQIQPSSTSTGFKLL